MQFTSLAQYLTVCNQCKRTLQKDYDGPVRNSISVHLIKNPQDSEDISSAPHHFCDEACLLKFLQGRAGKAAKASVTTIEGSVMHVDMSASEGFKPITV